MTKKEEFEKRFVSFSQGVKREFFNDIRHADVWSWIENEIRQAKIDELKKISELRLKYEEGYLGLWDDIMIDYLEKRTAELEKEK